MAIVQKLFSGPLQLHIERMVQHCAKQIVNGRNYSSYAELARPMPKSGEVSNCFADRSFECSICFAEWLKWNTQRRIVVLNADCRNGSSNSYGKWLNSNEKRCITGRDSNRWKFQGDQTFGVAMTSIQTFSEMRSLDLTWWPDLERPGSEIFTCVEKMYEQGCQNRGAQRRRFYIFAENLTEEGAKKNAPQHGAG